MRYFVLAVLLCLSATSFAQQPINQPGFTSPQPPAGPSAQQVVQQGVERLQNFLANEDINNPDLIRAFIENEVAPFFDFELMTRASLGPLNYQLSPQQFAAMQEKIRQQFLISFTRNLSQYRGSEIGNVNVSGNLGQGRVKVRILVLQSGEFPLIIELRITNGPNGWKIYDVSANGMSVVAYFRNYIRSSIQRSGAAGLLQ